MKKMTGSQIRAAFLKYFADNGHTVVSSSSLVPHDDPTLLFANAGMNQFKDIFLGKETRAYKRATSCQKVVRAGGKHNDLENVGRTARHHTFFEMLGNFSFGDYFKRDAINFAWTFLTKELELPAEKLFVTVYQDDDEAFNLWQEVAGLSPDKIYRKGAKDNFWQMGDTGPCGPCSEIFIDQGEGVGCGRPDCNPDCDCDRHLELWNLVFMQFNRDEEGNLSPLPKPSIDTGMGLERIAAIMQNKQSNYETDLIRPIIDYTARLAGVEYGKDEQTDISLRVIADHSRSTTFLIGDGVLPSNEKRGYTLRKIMRRAMRHGKMLGLEHEFFYDVCGFVVDFMKDHYVELTDKKSFIIKTVETEEKGFGKTLATGMKIIEEELLEKYKSSKVIDGEDIFKLYDTYGFPVDLLEDIASDAGYALDMAGFDKMMEQQQARAKASSLGITTSGTSDALKELSGQIVTEFGGYAGLIASGKILAMVSNDKRVYEVQEGDNVDIILDVTTSYAEGGGQAGDKGIITSSEGSLFKIENTLKLNDMIIHRGKVLKGFFKEQDKVRVEVDETIRQYTEYNHTATHLLHKALQKIVGDHARQAGSLVNDERLRFDFTHSQSLTSQQIDAIEMEVNRAIIANYPVHKRIEAVTSHKAFKYLSDMDKSMKQVLTVLKCQPSEAAERVADILKNHKALEKKVKAAGERIVPKIADTIFENVKEIKGIKVAKVLFEKSNIPLMRDVIDTGREKLGSCIIVIGAQTDDDKASIICGVSKDLTDKYNAGAIIKEIAATAGGSGGGKADMAQAGTKHIDKLPEALDKIYDLI